jgi:HEAT repeat protein
VIPEAPKYPSRWSAFLVLGLLRSESKQTVPIIRSYLADESGVLRGLAATALGLLGPKAADALPDLRQCLTDDWGSVREAATNAVLAIESRPRESSGLE